MPRRTIQLMISTSRSAFMIYPCNNYRPKMAEASHKTARIVTEKSTRWKNNSRPRRPSWGLQVTIIYSKQRTMSSKKKSHYMTWKPIPYRSIQQIGGYKTKAKESVSALEEGVKRAIAAATGMRGAPHALTWIRLFDLNLLEITHSQGQLDMWLTEAKWFPLRYKKPRPASLTAFGEI